MKESENGQTKPQSELMGPCALRHGIQNSMEPILACHQLFPQNDWTFPSIFFIASKTSFFTNEDAQSVCLLKCYS